MTKKIIQTNSAPKAIGTYSQAVQKNNIVFLSGQIPLNPETMDLVEGIEEQIHQVFKNMIEVIKAADSSTDDLVKLNIYLTDLSNFGIVAEIWIHTDLKNPSNEQDIVRLEDDYSRK